jgi:hypothetical protein
VGARDRIPFGIRDQSGHDGLDVVYGLVDGWDGDWRVGAAAPHEEKGQEVRSTRHIPQMMGL